ncbi:MAG TPA: hypothetical protein VF157_11430, partial [Chloroflexota bacterium]
LWRLARTAATASVARLTLWSFGLRSVVGLGLFMASFYHLPLFRSMQIDGGFWTLAYDARGYDWEGQAVLAMLHGAAAAPGPMASPAYGWLVGIIYFIFGADPGAGILLNGALAAACVPVAYLIARWSDMEQRGAICAAALVAFFPSSFGWSAQLLKDSMQWLVTLVFFAAAARMMSRAPWKRRDWLRVVPAASAMLLASLLTAWLRGTSTTPVLIASVIAGSGIWMAAGWLRAGSAAVLTRVLPAAVMLAAVGIGSLPAYGDVLTVAQRSSPSMAEPASPDVVTPGVLSAPDLRSCPGINSLVHGRLGFVNTGGVSLKDASVQFNHCWNVLAYVPRALELTYLEPWPADWFQPGASVGFARYVAFLDPLLLWLLFPGLVAGCILALTRPAGAKPLLAVYLLFFGFVLGFVVANFGTLYRVRLQVLLPAMIVAADGWLLLWRWYEQHLSSGWPRFHIFHRGAPAESIVRSNLP